MYPAYQQSAWGEWPQPNVWGACLQPAPIKASYQAGAQQILDLRPLELAVPYQWGLDPAFAPWLDVHAELNEVARAAMDTLDCRNNKLPTIVQYNIYIYIYIYIYIVMEASRPRCMPRPKSRERTKKQDGPL